MIRKTNTKKNHKHIKIDYGGEGGGGGGGGGVEENELTLQGIGSTLVQLPTIIEHVSLRMFGIKLRSFEPKIRRYGNF